ncbi:hypothetical protein MtrunA17_Chr7g0248921 [Medicago truncatula]|uniref:Uncharacterized protein n=1 Tax=Medicago truncatula TaxID=3880 RepID=Q2HV74_MEDTR|nr:hypothetical protein MtrDRAFT_AC148994g15v2 [Medicago truncatula]RHN47065.1 hypothetical protein MtrunA17_Chr7g0248921 [Medicago truncatula]
MVLTKESLTPCQATKGQNYYASVKTFQLMLSSHLIKETGQAEVGSLHFSSCHCTEHFEQLLSQRVGTP